MLAGLRPGGRPAASTPFPCRGTAAVQPEYVDDGVGQGGSGPRAFVPDWETVSSPDREQPRNGGLAASLEAWRSDRGFYRPLARTCAVAPVLSLGVAALRPAPLILGLALVVLLSIPWVLAVWVRFGREAGSPRQLIPRIRVVPVMSLMLSGPVMSSDLTGGRADTRTASAPRGCSRLDDQPGDQPVAQGEPEMQVDDAAGKVAFQVVDRVEVLVICSRRRGELDRVRVFAGRAGQPGADLASAVVVVALVGDDGVGGVMRDRGVEGAGVVRDEIGP